MKILYHHRVASKDGQYVHIDAIVSQLRAKGHEIIMVAPNVAEGADFGSDGGWVAAIRSKMPRFISELLEFSYSFLVFFKLLKAIRQHRPDVIYERYNLFLPAGIWAKKLCKLPLQLEVNSPLYDERKQYGGITLARLAKWSEYYAWRNADRVLPVTNVLADYIRAAGVSDDKIKVIPNGVDRAVFSAQEQHNRAAQFAGKIVVGFVGFCREWHQLDQVMNKLAAMNNRHIHFLVVGDGPVIGELVAQAESLGFAEAFTTTGLVSREDMPYWLDQIDIALQPAVTPWASPLKLLEYLAKGLAIVAPDTPNIKELLRHEHNALLFAKNNDTQMITHIQTLIENAQLRKALQDNALATIEDKRLSWSDNADCIVDWFNEHRQSK
ncbi:glycosyltransferase family 4 protein [Alteromonas gilva]|uniref:Glycosyltransferase family 4 protein n=1 Tax=Alteromonas gilva TaxID=2987522 RepID=A0ABT5L3A9_9ALTE|nr:glycosyltransferase family 4 protein [Alteromonas gilva]MDC8830332.1 glycosyltransferase family 4 protein [Alteromonas gilva]